VQIVVYARVFPGRVHTREPGIQAIVPWILDSGFAA
jgi:hypothetical protein